jgi:rSAM/selenodomain-associated transferase 2
MNDTKHPGARPVPRLSIVVPAVDEVATLPALLADLARLTIDRVEVIVADGGSRDRTPEIAAAAGARVVGAQRGRGRQLRAGADAARGALLCFLHADVRLDDRALAALARLVADPVAREAPHAFRLRIDAPGAAYRVVERAANARSRILGLPYGDQGLVVSRAAYDAAGGYADVPLMEDVMLVRALGRTSRVRLLDASLTVSARRWERDGVWRRSARNLGILARWLAGASPESLVADYDRARRR